MNIQSNYWLKIFDLKNTNYIQNIRNYKMLDNNEIDPKVGDESRMK